MTDYFAYNGEDVIPTYMPGVPSYGQEGSEGNTGDRGPSVYYTSYTLAQGYTDDIIECNRKIANNKLLSDNFDKDSYNEYMEGDLVIDSLGNIHKITYIDGVLAIPISEDVHDSTNLSGEIFSRFKCKISTSFLKNSLYSPKVDNPYYDKDNVASYKLYHSQRLNEKVYGNWITFSIVKSGQTSDTFLYYYNLVLPNGEVLTTVSPSLSADMFVDNKYLYGCFDCNNTMIANDEDAKRYFGYDIANIIGINSVNDLISYSSFKDNDEENIYATMLVSFYIHKFCSAYVEVRNTDTGKIYRYDLNEISASSSSESLPDEEDEETTENNYIEPYVSPVYWDYEKDASSNNYPIPEEVETNESITYTRSFDNYIVFPSRLNKTNGPDYIASSTYDFIQDFYFVDKRGLMLPEGFTDYDEYIQDVHNSYEFDPALEDSYVLSPLSKWYLEGLQYKSSTVKLKFSNISKFVLNVRFNKFNNPTTQVQNDLPYSVVYVGYPNVELWQEGDENGNVSLENSNISKVTDGETLYDGSTGVYYIYKIIPYGLELNDGTDTASIADAGFSVVTIDLTAFNLDLTKENWIQIGVMMFGEHKNSEHRPSVFPMDGVTVNENADVRDMVAFASDPQDSRRQWLGSTLKNVCYTFAETFIERGNEIEGNHSYSAGENNNEIDAGKSDVTLFINNITNYTEELDQSNESDTIDIINKDGLIDYFANGIKWDLPTYTVIKNQNN